MREIKFRGKRLDNEEWVYGFLFMQDGKAYIITDLTPCGFIKHEVNPATVGQLTGQYDKEGREIYEGDLITDGRVFHVLWDTRDACWTGEMHCDPEQRLDLCFLVTRKTTHAIGNIHDNPELLKTE